MSRAPGLPAEAEIAATPPSAWKRLATAEVTITEAEIDVRFQKRAHNQLLPAAGFDKTHLHIPWFGNKRLGLVFR